MSRTLDHLLQMAQSAAPVVNAMTGTPFAGLAVGAATAITALIDQSKTTFSSEDPAKLAALMASRDALEKSVNAHADRTINSLGDG